MAPARRAKPRSASPGATRTPSLKTARSSTSRTTTSWSIAWKSSFARRSKRARKKRLPSVGHKYQSVRGFNDVLPADAAHWQHLHRIAAEVFAAYGYAEIRLPILERTELFERSIGAATDVVEKEMFTFKDREGDSLTM